MAEIEFEAGHNCLGIAQAEAFSIIVDAEHYFRHARDAMTNARRRISLIGWDFDARIAMDPEREEGDGPDHLGDFILWLVHRNPELEIFLLQWDYGLLKTLGRGTTVFTLWRWMRHPRIHVKFDSTHPPGASHHQKIILIDDSLAFVGGIDMTAERWDTRDHIHDDPRRRRPATRRPYKPWHDATTAITGPVVDLVRQVAAERWKRAGGKPEMVPLTGQSRYWPPELPIGFEQVPLAISRSAPELDGRPAVLEIERVWLDLIACAKEHIYIESQYFASRAIVAALERRLAEADGPEIVVVNPEEAEGWLEPLAMDTARERLFSYLARADTHDRFRLLHPYDSGGAPIYVHAKIMVVDDRYLKIGSANINNRSLRLDTECDVTLAAESSQPDLQRKIAEVRNDLLAEHLDTDAETVASHLERTGSLIETIEHLRGAGRTLKPYVKPDLNGIEKWLAENEILDPEGPDEMLEPLTQRGLFRGLRRHFQPQ